MIELVNKLKAQRRDTQTKLSKLDTAINAIQDTCEHSWTVTKCHTNGHTGEEYVDYTCELCGLEKTV